MMGSPINERYRRENTIRAGRSKLAGWTVRDLAKLLKKQQQAAPAIVCPRCGHQLTGVDHGTNRVHRDHGQR